MTSTGGDAAPLTDAASTLSVDPTQMGGVDVARVLDTDPRNGLPLAEAALRLERVGPNRLTSVPSVPAWRRLAAQFADPLIYLLIGAVIVSLLAWASEGPHGPPRSRPSSSPAIVIANGVLGYVQERQAERAVAALERMAAPAARVVRGGREQQVDCRIGSSRATSSCCVRATQWTADARLLESAFLTVAEAALTGESESVLKVVGGSAAAAPLADRTDMVFSGTAVTRGRGLAVVTATGMAPRSARSRRCSARPRRSARPCSARSISSVGCSAWPSSGSRSLSSPRCC